MIRTLVILPVCMMLVACNSTSEVRMPAEPKMTPAAAAQFAAEAKFIVNDATGAMPEGKGHPGDQYLSVITTIVKSGLRANGRLAEQAEGALTMDIKVTEWRMRGGATREIFGVLAGKDGITSDVTVRDSSGASLGTLSVVTYNITSFGGEAVVKMHGEEIVKQVMEKLQAVEAAGS